MVVLWYSPVIHFVLKTADRSHSVGVDASLLPLAVRIHPSVPSKLSFCFMLVRELCEVFTLHSFPVNDNRHQFVSISWVWNFHEDEWSVSHQISSVPCTTVLGSFHSSTLMDCISPVLSTVVLFQSKHSLLGEHIGIFYCRLMWFLWLFVIFNQVEY